MSATLTNNTIKLQNLLERANNLPEASSGGDIKTCMLGITLDTSDASSQWVDIYYMSKDGDKVKYSSTTLQQSTSISLTNVICESLIVLQDTMGTFSGDVEIEGTAQLLVRGTGMFTLASPTVSEESCTVTVSCMW